MSMMSGWEAGATMTTVTLSEKSRAFEPKWGTSARNANGQAGSQGSARRAYPRAESAILRGAGRIDRQARGAPGPRVIGSIDDGGLRNAFSPLCRDFTMTREGTPIMSDS